MASTQSHHKGVLMAWWLYADACSLASTTTARRSIYCSANRVRCFRLTSRRLHLQIAPVNREKTSETSRTDSPHRTPSFCGDTIGQPITFINYARFELTWLCGICWVTAPLPSFRLRSEGWVKWTEQEWVSQLESGSINVKISKYVRSYTTPLLLLLPVD